MNTLKSFLECIIPVIDRDLHPKTIREYRRAVNHFCEWIGGDIELVDVTPELLKQFEQAVDTPSVRQLTSNLRSLIRRHDPDRFPEQRRLRLDKSTLPAERVKPPAECTTLAEFAAYYISHRDLCKGYSTTLTKRVAKFSEFIGAGGIRELLTEENLNRFLTAIGNADASPWTTNKYRQDLLTLWRAAADEDLILYPQPRRIRRLRLVAPTVECYTVEEVRALVEAAGRLKGGLRNGVAKRRYWPAVIRAAWDTGLRRGDVFAIRREHIRDDGTLLVTQSKTSRVVGCRFRPATIAAIEAAGGSLEWSMNEWSFGMMFRQITKVAGVRRGTFKWLRRASGSYVEAAAPGGGHKHLGHASPQIFDRHYDARLATDAIPMPPDLDPPAVETEGGVA